MPTKSFIFIALVTLGQARFGQEGLVQEMIQALRNFGPPSAGAAALVAAEKNFNPFAQSIPTLCSDASLPPRRSSAALSLSSILPWAGRMFRTPIRRNQGFENFTAEALETKESRSPAPRTTVTPSDVCGTG
ncbi:uncharacterized protein B0T15DRAFT_492826 [Chaetomium strumarium]|uniref:Uncharacterized protein n=1 Tax=Chaetomium strumarium TaxID=1170767 RepID=A0AAJ0GWD1_9PEZI|nr:hypothetical protein B0T15DRAFT_492826 [Chaetomium strumarium]